MTNKKISPINWNRIKFYKRNFLKNETDRSSTSRSIYKRNPSKGPFNNYVTEKTGILTPLPPLSPFVTICLPPYPPMSPFLSPRLSAQRDPNVSTEQGYILSLCTTDSPCMREQLKVLSCSICNFRYVWLWAGDRHRSATPLPPLSPFVTIFIPPSPPNPVT